MTASFSAFGARRRPAADAPCPCGGGVYGRCCGPVLAGAAAQTAEQLMRSRYTAFAVGDAAHLRETWHPSTRPERIGIDPDLRWLGLRVDEVAGGTAGERRGTVAFRARWRSEASGQRGELSERSSFVFQRGRWWYVAGDTAQSSI